MDLFSKPKMEKRRMYAELGSNHYQYELAECYHYGKDTPQDYREAFKWYVEAARFKYSRHSSDGMLEAEAGAMYMVAIYYAEGRIVQKNLRFALKLLENIMYTIKEKEEGREGLYSFIGDDLIRKIKNKYVEIINELMNSDNHPGAESYYQYLEKKDENKKAAMELLEYSASKGYEDAFVKFAYSIYSIDYTADRAEFERILEICTEAAKCGSARMRRFLADFYSENYYVNRNKVSNSKFDLNKAVEYYKKAADLGDVGAAVKLGSAYYFGILGLNIDYNKAKEWLLPVANRQFCLNENFWIIEAHKILGGVLLHLYDYMQAIHWYEKALELPWDDPSVSYESDIYWNIGGIYLHCLKQRAKAIEWFKRGIRHDSNPSCKMEMDKLGETY